MFKKMDNLLKKAIFIDGDASELRQGSFDDFLYTEYNSMTWVALSNMLMECKNIIEIWQIITSKRLYIIFDMNGSAQSVFYLSNIFQPELNSWK